MSLSGEAGEGACSAVLASGAQIEASSDSLLHLHPEVVEGESPFALTSIVAKLDD
jgi:hypothetical protein